ncbi:hypothetical protein Tco_1572380, partial [Tanacetum coccineum]
MELFMASIQQDLVGITIREKDSSELGSGIGRPKYISYSYFVRYLLMMHLDQLSLRKVYRLKQQDLEQQLQEQLEQHLVKDSITHQTLGEATNPSHSLLVEHYVLEKEVV